MKGGIKILKFLQKTNPGNNTLESFQNSLKILLDERKERLRKANVNMKKYVEDQGLDWEEFEKESNRKFIEWRKENNLPWQHLQNNK